MPRETPFGHTPGSTNGMGLLREPVLPRCSAHRAKTSPWSGGYSAQRTLTAGADSILQVDSDEHVFVLRFAEELGREPLERLAAAANAAGLRCVFDSSPVLRSPLELEGMAEALEEADRLGRIARGPHPAAET